MKNVLIAIIALGSTFGAAELSERLFEYRPRGFVVVGVYLVFYGVIQWSQSSTKTKIESFPNDKAPDRTGWPLSGPLGGLGPVAGGILFMVPFLVTSLMSVLNPFQLAQIIRQNIGNQRLKKREERTGKNGTEYRTKAKYRLPFDGEWLVFNGGRTPLTSHSWEVFGQRFALDFVQADAEFRRHRGRGMRLNDYYCHGQSILSAADGTVVSVENRISEAPFVGFGFCDFLARSFVGNYVMIQHAEGEYGLYAHLIKGSVSVHPGEAVKQGQMIGRCGHSGHSSEPHLHFHLQDAAELFNGMGLPVEFHGMQINGKYVQSDYVTAEQRVRTGSLEADQSAVGIG